MAEQKDEWQDVAKGLGQKFIAPPDQWQVMPNEPTPFPSGGFVATHDTTDWKRMYEESHAKLSAAEQAARAAGEERDRLEEDAVEYRRMIPDLDAVLTHNPIAQVFFRAGLLACRETMARFVEQGGSEQEKRIAQSIRANWWPSLGEDPGPPRQLRYDEVADEKADGRIEHKPMSPSIEALPRAWAFINPPSPVAGGPGGAERSGE